MFAYWANVFGMLGVALLATSFFEEEGWRTGMLVGFHYVGIGAIFHKLSLPRKEKAK